MQRCRAGLGRYHTLLGIVRFLFDKLERLKNYLKCNRDSFKLSITRCNELLSQAIMNLTF